MMILLKFSASRLLHIKPNNSLRHFLPHSQTLHYWFPPPQCRTQRIPPSWQHVGLNVLFGHFISELIAVNFGGYHFLVSCPTLSDIDLWIFMSII